VKAATRCGNCRRMQRVAQLEPYTLWQGKEPAWLTVEGGRVLHIACNRGLSHRIVAFCGAGQLRVPANFLFTKAPGGFRISRGDP
jgi:hypothetical protein